MAVKVTARNELRQCELVDSRRIPDEHHLSEKLSSEIAPEPL
jgi:hypothetical protein